MSLNLNVKVQFLIFKKNHTLQIENKLLFPGPFFTLITLGLQLFKFPQYLLPQRGFYKKNIIFPNFYCDIFFTFLSFFRPFFIDFVKSEIGFCLSEFVFAEKPAFCFSPILSCDAFLQYTLLRVFFFIGFSHTLVSSGLLTRLSFFTTFLCIDFPSLYPYLASRLTPVI